LVLAGSCPVGLFAAQCIFQTSEGALGFAYCLVSFTLRFQLGIARELAGRFLYGALGLLGRTLNSILVHLMAFPIVTMCPAESGAVLSTV
jgi:hypothetical protein